MTGGSIRARKAWAVASLGGLGAMVVGALLPGATASAAGPTSAPREPVDPDARPADDVSTGEFQSCSAYYGFGKSWAHVQVAVDGEVDDDIRYVTDYQLVLTGDLDGVPGDESCTPDRLTQADWDTPFSGLVDPYSAVTPLPPGDNIVIPGQDLTGDVVGPTLQLDFGGEFPGYTVTVDGATLPNFEDGAAYEAQYASFLVAAIGEPDATTFQTPCGANVSPEQEDAAEAAFAAMDPAFRQSYLDNGGNTDFSQCFEYNNLRSFFRDYWFPYAWGTGNPVTFELATAAAAPIVIEPTFTG